MGFPRDIANLTQTSAFSQNPQQPLSAAAIREQSPHQSLVYGATHQPGVGGSVKGKLTALDELVGTLGEELSFHKNEV
jgi:hypothetical protein